MRATAIDDIVEARQALELLAELPERQRDDLALLGGLLRRGAIDRLREKRVTRPVG